MSKEFWVLYDPNNKTQSDQLSTEETQMSLMIMKTKEINNYLIWKNEWTKWRKLKDFLDSDESPFMSTFLAKSPAAPEPEEPVETVKDTISSIKMTPANEDTVKRVRASFSSVSLEEVNIKDVFHTGGEQFDGESFNPDTSNQKSNLDFKNLNKHTAFSKTNSDDKYKIELLLIGTKGQIFRSIAKNISLSGTFSERIVPDEFHREVFDLVIINNFIEDKQYNRITLKAKVVITDASIYLQYVKPTDVQKSTLRAMLDYYVRSQNKII